MANHHSSAGRFLTHWHGFLRAISLPLFLFASVLAVTVLRASENTPAATIPFNLRRDQIMVPLKASNGTNMSFLLDTGFSMTMLHPAHAQALQLRRTGGVTIVGIAGEERADVFAGARFELGAAVFEPNRVASLPSDAQRKRRRDGVLGSGFFKRFVVELNFREKKLSLYEPKTFVYAGPGQIIPLEFKTSTPVVEAAINTTGKDQVKARFEIDTGCDGGLCLGHDFVVAHPWIKPSAGAKEGGRQGVGGGVKTSVSYLEQLQLGQLIIEKPTANFFEEGSPVDEGLAGHIGLEVLSKFKVIFDYSHNRMILEPYPQTAARSRP